MFELQIEFIKSLIKILKQTERIMVEIVSQPYHKTYVFPLFSFTFLTRVVLIVLTVVAPFFIVYKTGNFYQSSKTDYIDLSKVDLKPTYEYYISLRTSTQSYVFTNFFVSQANQAITVKFTQQPNQSLRVVVEYPKSLAQKVNQIDMYVPFTYINNNKNSYGIIRASLKGYDLADTATVGFLEFRDGTGESTVLQTDKVLRQNQFDFLAVYKQFYKSSSYLTYRYNSLPMSMPSDIFKLNMVINYPLIKVQEKTPSILGQLIWSWVQYFPILFVFYLVTEYVWLFLLKQGLVRRTIKHNKDYLQILRKQQDKRNQQNSSHHSR